MAIVTISHQLGSGGGEIAQGGGAQLGYRCVGAEMLAEAAQQHGLVEARLTRLGEAKPPILDRLAAERIIATFDVRVRRLAEAVASQTGRSPELPAAQDAFTELVKRDDADKAGRMRYLHERDIDDPRLDDLIVNTDKGDLAGATEAIARLARRPALARGAGAAATRERGAPRS